MTRILHLIILSKRYSGSKGSPERRQDDPSDFLEMLPDVDLKENASHHFWRLRRPFGCAWGPQTPSTVILSMSPKPVLQ